jgi:hypothetical protein
LKRYGEEEKKRWVLQIDRVANEVKQEIVDISFIFGSLKLNKESFLKLLRLNFFF